MNTNPSPEFALGQIVFFKSNPSTRGAVVEVLPGSPENRITVFAEGKIQSFDASQLQVSTSSDILNRIINAPPETIERIESLLQSLSESTPTISPTSQEEGSPANPVSNPSSQKSSNLNRALRQQIRSRSRKKSLNNRRKGAVIGTLIGS